VTGVRWAVVARAGSEVLAFAGAVVTARLIPPSAFGQAAVPLILMPLATILTFEGFASALVQRDTVTAAHRSAASLTSLACGLLLTLLTVAAATVLAEPVFGHETARLLAMMAPIFLLAAFGVVPRATLWRQLDFRAVGLIEVLGLLAGTITCVSLAVAGLDGEAIVLGALATTAARSALLMARSRPPLPRWHRGAVRDITGFGGPAALAGLVGVLLANIDYAILAARLGTAATGIYWRSFQLGVTYQDKVSGVMLQVAFPVYSRTGSREELRSLHERAARVHAAVVLPLLAGLMVLAPVFVPWAFGPQWEPAVVPTQILCGSGMVAAVLTGYPQVMLALGLPRELVRFNVAVLALYAAGVWFVAPYGIITVCVAVLVWHLMILFAVYRVLLRRHLGLPLRSLATDLGPALVCCAILVAAGIPARWSLEQFGAPSLAVLVGAGLACAVTYPLAMAAFFPALWVEVSGLAGRVLPSAPDRLRRRRAPAGALWPEVHVGRPPVDPPIRPRHPVVVGGGADEGR
jgi:PST family polysaccharide transporter